MSGTRWRLLWLAAVVLLVGCGVPQDDAPRALDPAQAPAGAQGRATAVPEPAGNARVILYFVRNGEVVQVIRQVPQPTSVEPLLDLLFAGPTAAEKAAGASSLIPSSLTVLRVEQQGENAVVTLSATDEQVRPEMLAYAQIVATLTPERAAGVRFRRDDADLPVPRADGSLTDAPVSRLDYLTLLAADPLPTVSAPPAPQPSG